MRPSVLIAIAANAAGWIAFLIAVRPLTPSDVQLIHAKRTRREALFMGLSTVHANSQDTPTVVLSYAAPADVVLHQPIVATVVARNSRPEPVRLRLGLGASRSFVVKIVRPDGVVIDAPAVPEVKDGPYDAGRRTVPTLGRYTHSLVLNRWYSFDQPGTYRIEVDLSTAVETESGVPVPSTTRGVLLVRVGGRNESALHRICQELLDRITQSTDPTVRYTAAVELANVTDDLAFTYIMQVIDFTDIVDGVLIPALIRMNTLQAQALLDEMAQSNNESRASMAMSALLDEPRKRHFSKRKENEGNRENLRRRASSKTQQLDRCLSLRRHLRRDVCDPTTQP